MQKVPHINRSRLVAAGALFALAATACGGGERPVRSETQPEPSRYRAKVDHPLVPLTKVRVTIFEGSERDSSGATVTTRVESRVSSRTARVAGVPVAVVKVREFENGKLVEQTRDYYAQSRGGTVWYLGEHVDDYKDGKLVGHGGQWLAGKDGARPGLFMPARPTVGQRFEQERAPGVAEDRSKVVAVGLDVTTPAGAFKDCVKTEDVAPLDDVTEFKYYCPGVGLVREEPPDGRLELVRYR